MSDELALTSATVYESDGSWRIRLYDSTGAETVDEPIRWDGSGGFYAEGLNWVVSHLRGYAYQSWQEVDGTYTTPLYRSVL